MRILKNSLAISWINMVRPLKPLGKRPPAATKLFRLNAMITDAKVRHTIIWISFLILLFLEDTMIFFDALKLFSLRYYYLTYIYPVDGAGISEQVIAAELDGAVSAPACGKNCGETLHGYVAEDSYIFIFDAESAYSSNRMTGKLQNFVRRKHFCLLPESIFEFSVIYFSITGSLYQDTS